MRPKAQTIHVVRWTGKGTGFSPRVAYCTTCKWVCAGAAKRVKEAAERHERTGR